jgi:hypothetical protein
MMEDNELMFTLSRNCAFQHSAHPALLAAETQVVAIQPGDPTAVGIDVLPRILLPLAGPEEFDLEVRQSTVIMLFGHSDYTNRIWRSSTRHCRCFRPTKSVSQTRPCDSCSSRHFYCCVQHVEDGILYGLPGRMKLFVQYILRSKMRRYCSIDCTRVTCQSYCCQVSEHIERLVNLLQGAEEAVVGTADEADDDDDKIEEV